MPTWLVKLIKFWTWYKELKDWYESKKKEV
jgi:hypothetical protein